MNKKARIILNNNINKINKFYLIFFKFCFHLLFLYFVFFILCKINLLKSKRYHKINLLYKRRTFIIISRYCESCGFFGDYNIYLGCLNYFVKKGYIPIIDQMTYPNYYNKFKNNSLIDNPWEIFFNQIYGLKLKEVLKNAKKIKFIRCEPENFPHSSYIYKDKISILFWHNFYKRYIPIKKNIKNEANRMMKILFNNSEKVLGVRIRGTDYISLKPKYHPIPPSAEKMINDIRVINNSMNFDYIYLLTEDDIIRNKFIKEFGKKLKYVPIKNINYNYKSKTIITYNKNIQGNFAHLRNYVISLIIFSKCKNIIAARTSGTCTAYIWSGGFNSSKIYYLGEYRYLQGKRE